VAAVAAVGLSGCWWNSLGRDLANSRHQPREEAIGTATAGDLDEVWRSDGLTGVTSTPAVYGSTVYVGTWSGAVQAVSAATGAEVWQTQVTGSGGIVDDSPLVTSDRVYVGDSEGELHALDRATGAPVWTRELDAHPQARIFSSPTLVPASAYGGDGLLVIGVASVELVLNKEDYTFRGSVVGLDPTTGSEIWRVPTSQGNDGAGVSVWSSAAVDTQQGLAYIGSGQAYEAPAGPRSDSLLAIDYRTGELAWWRQFTAGDVYTFFSPPPRGPDADIGASPNLFRAGGRDLVGVGDKAGVYAALDRATGETVWARQLTQGSALGGVMVTAAYGAGAGGEDGVIYVASNIMAPSVLYDPASGQHRSVTVALDAATGDVVWQHDRPGATFGALTVANGVLFQPTVPGILRGLDAATGDVVWTTEPGGDLGGGVSVANGRVFTGHGFWFLTASSNPVGGVVAYGTPGA
jgi:polyvinyl alcohol dehydrogenase (cytochrome)